MKTWTDDLVLHNENKPFSYLHPVGAKVSVIKAHSRNSSISAKQTAISHKKTAQSYRGSILVNAFTPSSLPNNFGGTSSTKKRVKRQDSRPRRPTLESFRRAYSEQVIPGNNEPVLGTKESVRRTKRHSHLAYGIVQPAAPNRTETHRLSVASQFSMEPSAATSSHESTSLRRRRNIAKEILETEQRYVDDLLMIQSNFVEPLMMSLRSVTPILEASAMSAVFSNFVDILHINATLLGMLQERLDPNDEGIETCWDPATDLVGDIFCSFGHYLKMYKTYCRNFTAAAIALDQETCKNRAFREFLEDEHRKSLLRGMSLQSHLLAPVQRIPRYRSLLAQALRYTPSDLPDHIELVNALRIIEEVADGINEAIKRHEAWQVLHRLERCFLKLDQPLSAEPGRILLKRGPVTKICSKFHQRFELFLFNDCLIYAKPVISSNSTSVSVLGYYIFTSRLPLSGLMVESVNGPLSNDISDRSYWRVTTARESFILYCKSPKQRSEWMDTISRARLQDSIAKSSIKTTEQPNPTLRIVLGRRASRIQASMIPNFGLALWSNEAEYPIFRSLPAPMWVDDAAAPACQLCTTLFSFFRGRHHCRICGSVICASCSSKRFMTSTTSPAYRACDKCFSSRTPFIIPQTQQPLIKSQDETSDGVYAPDVPPMHLGTLGKSMKRTQIRQAKRKSLLLTQAAMKASIRISCTLDTVPGALICKTMN